MNPVSMSEMCEWKVMPWEWQKAPEYWVDKLKMYFKAKIKTAPALELRRRRRAEREAQQR